MAEYDVPTDRVPAEALSITAVQVRVCAALYDSVSVCVTLLGSACAVGSVCVGDLLHRYQKLVFLFSSHRQQHGASSTLHSQQPRHVEHAARAPPLLSQKTCSSWRAKTVSCYSSSKTSS